MSRRSGRRPRAHQHNIVQPFPTKSHRPATTDEPRDEGEPSVGGAMPLADECMDDRPPEAPTPGDVLRRARHARGLSIEQIASRTKIGKTTLSAIEAGDVARLPALIYTRGFVRSFAQEVGLPPDVTADEYVASLPRQDTIGAAPAGEEHSAVTPPPHAVAHDGPSGGFLDRAERRSRQFGRVLTAAAALGLILYLASIGAQPEPNEAEYDLEPAVNSDVVPASRASDEGPRVADVTSATEAPLRVELAASAPCWLSVVVDGERVFARVLQPGERQTLVVEHDAIMRVGEPGALSISINGQPGRSLGRAGQPVSVTITHENYQQFLRS